jgi:hypothetical protein
VWQIPIGFSGVRGDYLVDYRSVNIRQELEYEEVTVLHQDMGFGAWTRHDLGRPGSRHPVDRNDKRRSAGLEHTGEEVLGLVEPNRVGPGSEF